MQNLFKFNFLANSSQIARSGTLFFSYNRALRFALLALLVLAVFLFSGECFAAGGGGASWAQPATEVGDKIITGLKALGRIIATIVGVWGAFEIWSGRKRFSDMMNWFVGAAVFLGVTEVVGLVFGSS